MLFGMFGVLSVSVLFGVVVMVIWAAGKVCKKFFI